MTPETTKAGKKAAVRSAVFVALRRSFYVLCLVAVWLLLIRMEVVHPRYLDTGTVIFGALLFMLALPTSIILRLDKLSEILPVDSFATTLLCGVLVVTLNWVIIAALRALLRGGQSASDGRAESDS